MSRIRNLSKTLLILIVTTILCFAGSASAVEELRQPRRGDEILLDAYHKLEARLEKNSFGFPLFLESFESGDRVHADVYGIFDHPFSNVLEVLKVPSNWCDIVSLHPNVKACTYREKPGAMQLIFYIGRKKYQPPADAHQVIYHYRNVEQRQGYLDVLLNADEGPFGTRDHKMRFEALPLEGGKTFVHVSYAYGGSAALLLAERAYFATLGWGKVGFTSTGTDRKGNPVYIGGPRGALERNAVRYYFAIESVLDTVRYPEESRFSARISKWYDLTIRYKKQLFDLEKKDYLLFKEAEHKNQVMLQGRMGPVLH